MKKLEDYKDRLSNIFRIIASALFMIVFFTVMLMVSMLFLIAGLFLSRKTFEKVNGSIAELLTMDFEEGLVYTESKAYEPKSN